MPNQKLPAQYEREIFSLLVNPGRVQYRQVENQLAVEEEQPYDVLLTFADSRNDRPIGRVTLRQGMSRIPLRLDMRFQELRYTISITQAKRQVTVIHRLYGRSHRGWSNTPVHEFVGTLNPATHAKTAELAAAR